MGGAPLRGRGSCGVGREPSVGRLGAGRTGAGGPAEAWFSSPGAPAPPSSPPRAGWGWALGWWAGRRGAALRPRRAGGGREWRSRSQSAGCVPAGLARAVGHRVVIGCGEPRATLQSPSRGVGVGFKVVGGPPWTGAASAAGGRRPRRCAAERSATTRGTWRRSPLEWPVEGVGSATRQGAWRRSPLEWPITGFGSAITRGAWRRSPREWPMEAPAEEQVQRWERRGTG